MSRNQCAAIVFRVARLYLNCGISRVLCRWPPSLHQKLQVMSYLVGVSDRRLKE